MNCSDNGNFVTETKYSMQWQGLPTSMTWNKKQNYTIEFVGYQIPTLFKTYVDFIPSIFKINLTAFQWWNTSETYRSPIYTNSTNSYVFMVNDTGKVNGKWIWVNLNNWTISNNNSVYSTGSGATGNMQIANDSMSLPFVDEVSQTGYNITQVFKQNNYGYKPYNWYNISYLMGEGTGTKLMNYADLSNSNMSIGTGFKWTSGSGNYGCVTGNCLENNGGGTSINTSSTTPLNMLNDYTFIISVYRNTSSLTRAQLYSTWGTVNWRWYFEQNSGYANSLYWCIPNSASNCVWLNTTAVELNVWKMITLRVSGTNASIWLNAKLNSSMTLSTRSQPTGVFCLVSPYNSCMGSGGNYPIYGQIDNVFFTTRALSDIEIKALYNTSVGLYSRLGAEQTYSAGATNYYRETTDSFTFSDQSQRNLTLLRLSGDSITFSDIFRRSINLKRDSSDSISFSDLPVRIINYKRTLPDSLQFIDQNGRSINFQRLTTDIAQFTDQNGRNISFIRANVDSVQFLDSNNRNLVFLRNNPDTIIFNDSAGRSLAYKRSNSDTIIFNDTNPRKIFYVRSSGDFMSFLDSINSKESIFRSATDTIIFNDSSGRKIAYQRATGDYFLLIDSPSNQNNFQRAVGDIVGFVDSIKEQLNYLRTNGDQVTFIDFINRMLGTPTNQTTQTSTVTTTIAGTPEKYCTQVYDFGTYGVCITPSGKLVVIIKS